jgi:hypothetical protein
MRWREGDSIAVHATSRMPPRRSAPHLERWGGQGGAVRQWVQVGSSQGKNRLTLTIPWLAFISEPVLRQANCQFNNLSRCKAQPSLAT